MVLFLLVLFPTGRLPSRRWRVVVWAALGYIALFTLVSWLSPHRKTCVCRPSVIRWGPTLRSSTFSAVSSTSLYRYRS